MSTTVSKSSVFLIAVLAFFLGLDTGRGEFVQGLILLGLSIAIGTGVAVIMSVLRAPKGDHSA